MLKIYQGRENIDKEKFIYEHTEGETLVIVPNQYTLVAEEQALKYLNTSCLLNVEILSMNRLGLRMLQEQGTDNVRMLDRYERYMLLARIIRNRRTVAEENPGALRHFGGVRIPGAGKVQGCGGLRGPVHGRHREIPGAGGENGVGLRIRQHDGEVRPLPDGDCRGGPERIRHGEPDGFRIGRRADSEHPPFRRGEGPEGFRGNPDRRRAGEVGNPEAHRTGSFYPIG